MQPNSEVQPEGPRASRSKLAMTPITHNPPRRLRALRRSENKAVNGTSPLRRKPGTILVSISFLACALAVCFWVAHLADSPRAPRLRPPSASPNSAATFEALISTPPGRIGGQDIALVNLLCADCLPGAEGLNPQECLGTLHDWAEHVRSETERHLYRYRVNPAEFESSEGYFRMLMMAVVMYEDCGIRYNPDRISEPSGARADDAFFADSRDIFLHGLCGPRRLGTCSSMPVLYAAIGRRLGYPLKLATTKSHVFLRWESATERFNLEATGKGMSRYDDEHFKRWPFPVTEDEIRADGYLKSLAPAEEMALFLSLRGHCLRAAGRMQEAASVYAQAVRYAPEWPPYRLLLAASQSPLAPDAARGTTPEARTRPVSLPLTPSGPPAQLSPVPDPNPLLKIR